MRAISYVNLQESLKAGTLYGHNWSSNNHDLSNLKVFDKELRRLAAVIPRAECMAGDSDYASWFMADFNVGDQLLVLTYDKWGDGCFYWNVQRNTDVDGPEGIIDLKRSKTFGPVLNYIRMMISCKNMVTK